MSATHEEWWANLSASQRMTLRRNCWKYLRRVVDVPALTDMTDILFWQQIECDVLDAHVRWLSCGKAWVEALGEEWTLEECRRYDGWTL